MPSLDALWVFVLTQFPHFPKLSVEGSIPFARSNVFKHLYRYQVRRLRTKPKRFADGLQIPFLDGSPIWLLR